MGISKKTAQNFYEHFRDLKVKIPWRYYKYILRNYYGFEMYPAGRTSGSKRAFNNGEIRFTAHEPHGGDDIVDKVSRINAIRAIEMLKASE